MFTMILFCIIVYLLIGYSLCMIPSIDDEDRIFAWTILWPIIVITKAVAELIDIFKDMIKENKS